MACSKGELWTGSVSNEEVVLKSSAGAFGFRAFVAQTPLPPLTQDIELVYLPVLHLRISFTVNLGITIVKFKTHSISPIHI